MPNHITHHKLVTFLHARAAGHAPFVIGLSGFGGSGKSMAAEKLATALGDADVIHLDDFILDRLSARSADWDGFEWTRLIAQVLRPVSQEKKTITYDAYDWATNRLASKKMLNVRTFVIVEGVGLIRSLLKPYFDATIWIDLPLEVAAARGARRDREEYKAMNDELWETRWVPNDRDYFDKYHPRDKSDFLLTE